MTWLTSLLGLPPEALKAIGMILVGALIAGGTYVVGRIKESRKPPEQVLAGGNRIALDPADRDLGYSLVRAATDLTRGLHDHGERLREHSDKLKGFRCPGTTARRSASKGPSA